VGNIDIEEREMIPEAAVQLSGSRFRIYLRSNFKDHPGMRIRRRFSLAHEIVHTFFFEVHDGDLRPMRDGPRGIDLESACHEGAGRLLVPERLLREELKEKDGAIPGEDVLRLAETFDVSIEVVLRRLRKEPAIELSDVCFALCRLGKIEYAMYPRWLEAVLRKPANTSVQGWFRTSQVSFQGWFRASGLEIEKLSDGSYIGNSDAGTLSARRLPIGSSAELFEIRRYPAQTSSAEIRSRLLGVNGEAQALMFPDLGRPNEGFEM